MAQTQSIHPTLKTYEDFLQNYETESESAKQQLYKQATWAQKEIQRKKGQYLRRKERKIAARPANYEEIKPKVGRPRKVNPQEVKLEEEKASLQTELETLRKEIVALKESQVQTESAAEAAKSKPKPPPSRPSGFPMIIQSTKRSQPS